MQAVWTLIIQFIQDELAENAIPDPQLGEYLDVEDGDFDTYEYWMDMEFGSDDYYDVTITAPNDDRMSKTGEKRKRVAQQDHGEGKRRKVGSNASSTARYSVAPVQQIIWMSMLDTHPLREVERAHKPTKSYALLPDWRERFKNIRSPMAIDASAVDERTMKDTEAESDSEDSQQDDMDIDPRALQAALEAQLSGAGVDGAGGQELMQSIMQMIATGKGANAEDMLEEMTAKLLDQVEGGGADSAISRWLAQKGVSIPNDDSEDDEDDESDTAPLGISAKQLQDLEASPRDSAVDGSHGKQNGQTQPGPADTNAQARAAEEKEQERKAPNEVAPKKSKQVNGDKDESSSVKAKTKAPAETITARKRKATGEVPESASESSKRRARSFAAPTASSQGKATETVRRSTRGSKPPAR